jgi:adenine/guanine phosphoribosyltransferase-like PRPP-binding protein
MKAMRKAGFLLAASVALSLSCSYVFARTVGPGPVHSSGTSAAPSGAPGGQAKYYCGRRPCHPPGDFYHPPGHTQPTCH